LNRPAKNTPEIQRADLAEVVLLLHSLGIKHAADFGWLDRPDRTAVERAEKLLTILGALSADGDLTSVGRQMLRLPMHPRYSRMLVEASDRQCVPAAAMCAALVSGRDLLMRVSRDDPRQSEAREVFEGSEMTDFHTLMRAQQHARNCDFNVDACRRAGIHAATARQVEDTYRQLLEVAAREKLFDPKQPQAGSTEPVVNQPAKGRTVADDPLLLCITAGFADQLAVRKDTGSLDCLLTEGRTGTLMRESVVQRSPLFTAASVREISGRNGVMTLLGMATGVRPEWLELLFPQHLSWVADHVFDRTHRRVAAIRRRRFLDLAIATEHSAEVDPEAAGRCLAEAFARGSFELPLLDHEVRQFIARVHFLSRSQPGLEFPAFDAAAMAKCLARAFHGVTLVKEAQAVRLLPAFQEHLALAQREWLNELAPMWVMGPGDRRLKLTYAEPDPDAEPDEWKAPETQIKLTECFALTQHPVVAEGNVPVGLQLQAPDGKRLAVTTAFGAWKTLEYPKIRSTLKSKYPGFMWP
jgi:ATP-dependent helicase HrpB